MWKAPLPIHVCIFFLLHTWIHVSYMYIYIVFNDLSKHSIPILSEELWMLFRGTLLWNLASFLQGNWKHWLFCFCVQRLYVEVWLKIFHRSDQRFFGGMLLPAKFSSLRTLFMDMISCLCINLYQDLATEELQMSFGEMFLRTFTFVLHGKLNLSTEHHQKIFAGGFSKHPE